MFADGMNCVTEVIAWKAASFVEFGRQAFNETVGVAITVVEGNRRHSKGVRLTPVTDHAFRDQPIA